MAQFFDTQGDHQRALGYYLQAARQDNKTAQSKIAELWISRNLPVKATDEQIKKYVDSIIEREEVQANKTATEEQRHNLKQQVTADIRKGETGADEILPWLEKNAAGDDATAQCQLARVYSSVGMVKGVPANPETTVMWLNKGLRKNTPCSRTLANDLLDADTISPQEQEVVVAWIKKEAENDALAQDKLGYLYLHGSAVIEQNKKAALKVYYKMAGNGDVATQCDLGDMYLSGNMLKKSFVTGMAFYYLAASGKVVSDNSGNNYWIKLAKEKIAATESEYPEKAAALVDARQLAQKLIMKFQEKS